VRAGGNAANAALRSMKCRREREAFQVPGSLLRLFVILGTPLFDSG
jgi:hypothetical protein